MTLRGIFAGSLALIALQAAVSRPGRVGGLLGAVAGLVQKALDPSVPLVPDLRGDVDQGDGGGGGGGPKGQPKTSPPGIPVPQSWHTPSKPRPNPVPSSPPDTAWA